MIFTPKVYRCKDKLLQRIYYYGTYSIRSNMLRYLNNLSLLFLFITNTTKISEHKL